MPLELPGKLRARLKEVLLEILPEAQVISGSLISRVQFHDRAAQLDKALPSTGRLHDRLVEALGPDACSNFVPDALATELQQFIFNPEAPEQSVGDLIQDIDGLATRLLDSFESLPWRYSLTFKLPAELAEFLGRFVTVHPIGSGARLIKIDEANQPTQAPPNTLGQLLLAEQNAAAETLAPGDMVLQIDAIGYIKWSFDSPCADQSLTTLRSIIGLGLALGLFKEGNRFQRHDKRTATVHRQTDNGPEYVTTYGLTHAESRAIGSLSLGNSVSVREDEADQIAFAKQKLNALNRIFDNPEAARTIMLAGKWYSDGTFGDDDLLNYVQITMVLEILLGDKATSDQIGLGTLLANRCAYLIGRSHSERKSILDDFARIYTVRSQIVHRGKHRLGGSEKDSFFELRWLAARVILEETKLLFADLNTTEAHKGASTAKAS